MNAKSNCVGMFVFGYCQALAAFCLFFSPRLRSLSQRKIGETARRENRVRQLGLQNTRLPAFPSGDPSFAPPTVVWAPIVSIRLGDFRVDFRVLWPATKFWGIKSILG
jgi:hypothetical protein